jgi:hypothetical protein
MDIPPVTLNKVKSAKYSHPHQSGGTFISESLTRRLVLYFCLFILTLSLIYSMMNTYQHKFIGMSRMMNC